MIFNKKIFLPWLWVGVCSIGIFLTIPIARWIQEFVSNKWGRELFAYFVLVVLAAGVITLLYFLIFKLKIRTQSKYIWLFLIAAIYIYCTIKLWNSPEEAVHFLEYGLLGFFLFKALSLHIKDKSIYFTATLLALLVGTFDEIIQWIIPQRCWDFLDVGLNALSGGLFQLAIFKIIHPNIISEKFNIRSLRIFTSIFALCLIILALCASNTTQKVAYYTKRIPFLYFLQKEEPMSEFGYKYKDSDIGIFYSRLNPKKLEQTDEQKGEEYAQILNESVNKKYQQFIREYSPITNPFMHELRVHIFRRDQYFKKGNNSKNEEKKKALYFIAYKENLILKKYYTNSIKNSKYLWSEEKLSKIEGFIDKDKAYISPVSANLITAFSENTMWLSTFSVLALLMIINLFFSLKKSYNN